MEVMTDAVSAEIALNTPQIWALGGVLVGVVIIFALVAWAMRRSRSAVR